MNWFRNRTARQLSVMLIAGSIIGVCAITPLATLFIADLFAMTAPLSKLLYAALSLGWILLWCLLMMRLSDPLYPWQRKPKARGQ